MEAKKVGILLILFMLVGGFAIAPYVQQAAFVQPAANAPALQLPDTNIVDYELTSQQETALLQQGKTIVKLEYKLNCQNCFETKGFLEQLANNQQFKGQIVVEEVLSPSSELPKVNILGFAIAGNQIGIAQKSFTSANVTQDNIVGALCDVMLQPPPQCALRNA